MSFIRLLKQFWFVIIGIVVIIIICFLPKNSTLEAKVYKNTNHEYKTKICVYVEGEVSVTGKMYFYDTDTVLNLLRASGYTEYTNTSSLKLDEKLKDGTTYNISIVDDNEKTINIENKTTQVPVIDTSTNSNISVNVDESDKININKATLEELKTLPGIGDARAKKIIAYRETTPFGNINDLKNVDGISEAIYEGISSYITC